MGWGERKDTMVSTAELKLNIQAFAKKVYRPRAEKQESYIIQIYAH